MKKLPLACTLAAIAFALPAAACNTGIRQNGTEPNEEIGTLPPAIIIPSETPLPETGATEKLPNEEPNTEEPPVTEEPPATEAPPAEEPADTVKPQPPETPKRTEYLKINASSLTVRTGAGTSYSALGSVEKNILMKYTGKTDDWYETAYRGKKAYVSAKYASVVSLEKADAEVEAVVENGLKFIGTPYVYGATRLHDGKGKLLTGFTTAKFDCSSLMQYIFYNGADVLLNMTTRTQILQGKAVKSDDLKRGDLMFFTNASRKNNTGIERVGHVALYLGDNYILHTASDYAKIEQISSQRWSYFIQARRMV